MSKVTKVTKESENEDDPYESSGDEWKTEGGKKRGSGRRTSTRAKKPKVKEVEESEEEAEEEEEEEDDSDEEEDSDDSDEEDEDGNKKSKNGVKKKKKVCSIVNSTRNTPDGVKKVKIISSGDFATGSFVILKKDAQVGDPSKNPNIWRIDGKALLQKYEPLTQDGKVHHKNTSIYAGWSPIDRDLYAPVLVYVHSHSNQNMVVEVDWDKLKEINMDSD